MQEADKERNKENDPAGIGQGKGENKGDRGDQKLRGEVDVSHEGHGLSPDLQLDEIVSRILGKTVQGA